MEKVVCETRPRESHPPAIDSGVVSRYNAFGQQTADFRELQMRVSALEEQIREILGELEINTDAHCKMREQIYALMGQRVTDLGRREQMVLEMLDDAGGQMSLGALAAELHLSRYALYRVLKNLKGYGGEKGPEEHAQEVREAGGPDLDENISS